MVYLCDKKSKSANNQTKPDPGFYIKQNRDCVLPCGGTPLGILGPHGDGAADGELGAPNIAKGIPETKVTYYCTHGLRYGPNINY